MPPQSKLRRLYHHSMYDATRPVPSYWESTIDSSVEPYTALAGDATCDVAVVGGGYTGLSAALHLARDHSVEVRVLEAGHIGWGASGRNGGFCTLGATKLSIDTLVHRYGLDEARRYFAAQLEGIDLVRALGVDEQIDFEPRGAGTFDVAHRASRTADLAHDAEALARVAGVRTRLYSREQFAEIGHESTEQFGALHVGAGFALHPLKFALGLARAAARHGALLHPHSAVIEWRREGGAHRLLTEGGSLSARRVIVATNGFTRDGLHPSLDGVTMPVISNIITTRPLTNEELGRQGWRTEAPICNTRALLFYYRLLPDGRFLFGARGDMSGSPAAGEKMKRWMTRRLAEVFPGWRGIPVSHFWRGFVCGTRRLTPAAGRFDDDPSVWFGFGYHGNGVNTAPWVGMRLAAQIAGRDADAQAFPAVMRGMTPPFPCAALRRWFVPMVYAYYHWQDAR